MLKVTLSILRLSFKALSSFILTSPGFIEHIVRKEKGPTICPGVVFIHSVYGAVNQGMQQSCRHITDVLALIGGKDDGEVDHHTSRGKTSDLDSHLA